jgi:molybdopterin/thiamine biosynthesis adenylyltransferase
MKVAFCGVGALGSSAAVLCRNLELEGRLLVDFDKVESKNLLAQAYVKQSLGKNKAEALKLQLLNFWGVRADAAPVRITPENADAVLGGSDLIVDAFDNRQGRLVLSELARRANKALVHAAVSADGTFGLVRWDERFSPDAEDVPGQATCEGGEHLPLLGVLSATLARAVQDYVKKREKWDAMVSLYGVTVMRVISA